MRKFLLPCRPHYRFYFQRYKIQYIIKEAILNEIFVSNFNRLMVIVQANNHYGCNHTLQSQYIMQYHPLPGEVGKNIHHKNNKGCEVSICHPQ